MTSAARNHNVYNLQAYRQLADCDVMEVQQDNVDAILDAHERGGSLSREELDERRADSAIMRGHIEQLRREATWRLKDA